MPGRERRASITGASLITSGRVPKHTMTRDGSSRLCPWTVKALRICKA